MTPPELSTNAPISIKFKKEFTLGFRAIQTIFFRIQRVKF